MTFYSYNYLLNRSFLTNSIELKIIIGCIMFLVIFIYLWMRGNLDPRNRDLMKLLAILTVLIGAVLINDQIAHQSEMDRFRSNIDRVESIAEYWHVNREKIAISTQTINSQTLYLIDDQLYRVFWGDGDYPVALEKLIIDLKGKIRIRDK